MAIRGWVGGLFAAVWAGCGAPQGTAPEEPTWHGAVRPILDRSCVSCHDASGGPSGISLASYADARTWREAIGVAVAEGTMPPWLAEDGCTDYLDDYSLSPGARETLLAWVDAGAPEGDPATARPPDRPLDAARARSGRLRRRDARPLHARGLPRRTTAASSSTGPTTSRSGSRATTSPRATPTSSTT